MKRKTTTALLGLALLAAAGTAAQSPSDAGGTDSLVETGQVTVDGHMARYLVRHLPLNAFPQLPAAVSQQLAARGCLIPQTYEARRPENVVHGSFEAPGSSDWAVLCSTHGTVSLLVFFGSGSQAATVLASAPETERLQAHDPTGVLGFNWGIDAASPRQVADAQAGMPERSTALDHDALADSVVDRKTVYHFYGKGAWTLIETAQ